MARLENGDIDSNFNVLDNDYVELASAFWDTDENIKEGLEYLTLSRGPELKLCGKEYEVELLGVGLA